MLEELEKDGFLKAMQDKVDSMVKHMGNVSMIKYHNDQQHNEKDINREQIMMV